MLEEWSSLHAVMHASVNRMPHSPGPLLGKGGVDQGVRLGASFYCKSSRIPGSTQGIGLFVYKMKMISVYFCLFIGSG